MEFWKHMGNILHDCTLPWIENYQLYISKPEEFIPMGQ